MRSKIGLNLPGVRPTDRGAVFNEATASADWFRTADNKAKLPLAQVNAAGYPASDFCWQVFYKCPPASYNGTYAVEIDGTVQGIAGLSSPLKVLNLVTGGGKTTATIIVSASKPGETAGMTLKFTGVQNVTRIRIWRGDPPADRKRRWNTLPIDLMRRANCGVVRGMELFRINSGRPVVKVTDLTDMEAPTYCYAGPDAGQETGCPPQYLIDACNQLKADCWFNCWIDAEEATLASVFALARDWLDPEVTFRLESHNELWNNRFSFKRAHDLAQRRGAELAAAGEPGFVGISDPNVLGWRYNAYRAKYLVTLARDVFGAKQRHRVKGTLCGQAWDNRPLDEARKYLKEIGVNPRDYFDAYAIAGYFGESPKEPVGADGKVSAESYLAPGYTLDGKSFPGVFLADSAVAAAHHHEADQFFEACQQDGTLPMGYETGTGFTSAVPGLVPNVLIDPRVKGVNVTAMDTWRDRGGDCWLKFTAWGPWSDDSSYGATDNPSFWSPTLQAFEEYGPTWEHPLPPKPDPRDQLIADLTAENAALTAQLAKGHADAQALADSLK